MTTDTNECAQMRATADGANKHAAVIEMRRSHGVSVRFAAELLSSVNMKPGSEANISQMIGVHIGRISDLLKVVYIESNTGATSTAMQELSAHLEGCSNVLKNNLAVAKIFDREAALDALCNAEVAGNCVAVLAGFEKIEADCRVADSTLLGFPLSDQPPDLSGLY